MKRIFREKLKLKRQVLVTLKTGDAFRGVLWDGDGEAVVLRNAEQLDPRSERQYIPADGEIVILVADVAYFQFL